MAVVSEGGFGAVRVKRAVWMRDGRRARPVAEILEGRRLLSTIIVNTTGDADGADGSSTLSLRQAIEIANGTLPVDSLTASQQSLVVGALSTPDTIAFDIPGVGPFTIEPTAQLPTITSPVTIDGYSQPGAHPNTNGPRQADNAALLIELDGSAVADDVGLDLSTSGITVQGLAIGGFQVAIYREAAGTGDTAIRGDFIGTDATGTEARPNGTGIDLFLDSSFNTIGGTTPEARNIISGSRNAAIDTDFGSGNLVEGNLIGTDATGTRALPNAVGIDLFLSKSDTIGGTAAGAGNVISGNTGAGVKLEGLYSLVEGNFIGTDVAGTTAVPDGTGIEVDNSAGTTIGGTTAGAGNVISGNATGIDYPSRVGSNLIEGNFIGTDPTGTRAVPNGVGIHLVGSDFNTIGGTAAGAGNVISGNLGDGVDLFYSSGYIGHFFYIATSDSNTIEGNFIGADPTGTIAVPNAGDGIAIEGGGANTIGGTAAGAGNVIAFNGEAGVGIASMPSSRNVGNAISGNSIYANGALGIDLDNDGVTPNNPAGSPDGPNLLQPYPVLTSAVPTAAGSLISATLGAAPSTSYTVEFFANPAADPSGFGQGTTYLGSAVATTDATGHASFSSAIASNLAGQFLSATATDPKGNTSEFAGDIQAYHSTTTTLTLGQPIPTLVGRPLTLIAAVAPGPGGGTPSGQVDFTEDGRPIGSASLDAAGAASLTVPAPAGPHVFAASYAGSAVYDTSTSNQVAATFIPEATTTTLIGPSTLVTTGRPVPFAAVVASASGVVPTGMVAFAEDGVVLGQAPLDARGVALFFTNTLAPGPHVIAAVYTGDAADAPSLSNPVAAGVLPALAFGGPTVSSDAVTGTNSVRIAFSRPLLLGTAQDRFNYTIVGPDGRPITVTSAAYDMADDSVTLTTRQELASGESYRLKVNGVRIGRVVDTDRIPLEGNGRRPGTSFVGKVAVKGQVKAQAHPSRPKPKAHPRKGH